MIKEDIQPGYAPEEISFGGYTTKNLHHSADAAKAFQDTIDRVGQAHPAQVLAALKATDTYMKLNDMHLEQGQPPTSKEIASWMEAHIKARQTLGAIGEFIHHQDYWHMHEHELQDILTNYNPETAGAEMSDSYQPQGDLVEELTDKTIRQSDKVKVARVIADMLGVENAESMSPEVAISTGLRKIKNKRMTPEMIGVVKKMLALAQEVGVKVDMSLVPKAVTEAVVVNPELRSNIGGDILRFKDHLKLHKLNQGIVPVGEDEEEVGLDGDEGPEQDKQAPEADKTDTVRNLPTQIGSSIQHPADDQMRRRKAMYKMESVELDEDMAALRKQLDKHTELAVKANRAGDDEATKKHQAHVNKIKEKMAKLVRSEEAEDDVEGTSDYKTDKAGRKHPAHRIVFKKGEDDKSTMHEQADEDEVPDLSDDELEKMANEIDHEDDLMDVIDDDELAIIDQDTGEEIKEELATEEALNEVLSRLERMRARIRFIQTQQKRSRRLQIVLKRRSDTKTINKRARRLAIKMMKERMLRKPLAKMTVSEKERAERMVAQRAGLINRLAMRLVPRVRRIEADRLTHNKAVVSKPAPAGGAGMM